MTGSENSAVNVATKIDSTPSRKRAPPSDDEKSSAVKQKVKKKRVETPGGTPVRQKSKTDVSKIEKDIPKIKKIERKKWDFSPLDPNEWEFENGEFICIFCGTDQQTIEKMESHFMMPPNCCEKFDKIESLFESDDAASTTSTSNAALEKEQTESVSTQPPLESILESQDEEIPEDQPKKDPEDKKHEEKPTEEVKTKEDKDLEEAAEKEVLEEKSPPEEIQKATQDEKSDEKSEKLDDKTDNMNSKPNETDKTLPNDLVDNPPAQDDPVKKDDPKQEAEVPKKDPLEDPVEKDPGEDRENDPEKDDPNAETEDDPVPSLDSSLDSDEFKCKHCEVDPFPNEDELKQHIKLKHEIKCKFCDSTFPSRGYMMTHQRNDHPKELKALQERRKSKKAQKAAS